jgi:tripartite ATP-independent transporter DctP family solute receptor
MKVSAPKRPHRLASPDSDLSRRSFLSVTGGVVASTAGGLLASAFPAPAIAQIGKAKVVAKFAHDSGIVSGAQSYGMYLAGRVAELTEGEVEIQLYPASQLGSGSQLIQAVKQGTVEFTIPTSVLAGTIVTPELGVLGLPYLIKDWEMAGRVEYSQAAELLRERSLKAGVRILAFAPNDARILLYKMRGGKPVLKVEDVENMKVRIVESPVDLAEWKACGALPTPVSFGEVYNAMQQGVVTGVDNGFNAGASIRLDEVIDAVSLTNHRFEINTMITNEAWFQSLSKRNQAALQDAALQAALYQHATVMWDSVRLPKLWLEKHNVKTFIPDRSGFIKKMTMIYPQFEATYGKSLIELVAKI